MKSGFLARQPILKKNGEILGYELLYRPTSDSIDAGKELDDLQAGSLALLYLMTEIQKQESENHSNHLVFIKAGDKVLKSELISLINPKSAVFELQESAFSDDECLRKIDELYKLGHYLLLENFALDPKYVKFWKMVEYIKVDAREKDEKTLLKLLNVITTNCKAKVILEKVETSALHELGKKVGVSLFQGYYFAKPNNLVSKPLSPSVANVMKLLNLIKKEANIRELEDIVKKEPSLAFKILRYINSPAFGLQIQVDSLRHAITVLGYQKLYEWLSILVMHANPNTPIAVIKTALLRAKIMEGLLGELCGVKEKDDAFVVGMFSLLDIFLQIPLDKAVEQLSLSAEIKEALLTHEGIYGPYLELVKCLESGEYKKVKKLLSDVFMTEETLNQIHLDAISWVEENTFSD